jgi:Spy/CpxP family protein refolding chaperone
MRVFIAIALLFLSAVTNAEPASPGAGDELAQHLFAPELVIKYRQDIGLDEAQSKALKDLVQHAQSHFLDLQWNLQAETGKLAQLVRSAHVDETAAIAQADRVLTLEREVKEAQLSLLIRIKNLLSGSQQEKLLALRDKSS